jgi:hypothetical protein
VLFLIVPFLGSHQGRSRAIEAGSIQWRSLPTGSSWPRALTTVPCYSGGPAPGGACRRSKAVPNDWYLSLIFSNISKERSEDILCLLCISRSCLDAVKRVKARQHSDNVSVDVIESSHEDLWPSSNVEYCICPAWSAFAQPRAQLSSLERILPSLERVCPAWSVCPPGALSLQTTAFLPSGNTQLIVTRMKGPHPWKRKNLQCTAPPILDFCSFYSGLPLCS